MSLRKIFSFLRTTSTLLAVGSLVTFAVEIGGVSSHQISHSIQHAQPQSSQTVLITDGCGICRAYSFLAGNESFLPRLETFTSITPSEILIPIRRFILRLHILPPARAPPAVSLA